jgi:hypothetical protein
VFVNVAGLEGAGADQGGLSKEMRCALAGDNRRLASLATGLALAYPDSKANQRSLQMLPSFTRSLLLHVAVPGGGHAAQTGDGSLTAWRTHA